MQPSDTNKIITDYRNEMARRIVGQTELVDSLLVAMIAGAHVLIEGLPGLAKTLAVKSLAQITGLNYKRIQFTPDLLPADLTGTLVWEAGKSDFSMRKGPIFANIVLADEINRAPAKVQSALLEAMEEEQVTLGDETLALPEPFFVLATQNPIEHDGTYNLPEAELDRFMLKIIVPYPSETEELSIAAAHNAVERRSLLRNRNTEDALNTVLDIKNLEQLRNTADAVHIDSAIEKYIVQLVRATRHGTELAALLKSKQIPASLADAVAEINRYITYGASPRGTIALRRCAKIQAALEGRDFVLPEDVKKMALPVLRHRVILSYEAEADGLDADYVVGKLLSTVPLP
jgi:MoxR-like ATPase